MEPEAGFELATTRLGGDNPILRPIEKECAEDKSNPQSIRNLLSAFFEGQGLNRGVFLRDGIRTRDLPDWTRVLYH